MALGRSLLLNLRRAGERAGRLAERLSTSEKTHEIQRQMLEAASRRPADRGLSACAMARFDEWTLCPPVVEYSAGDLVRAAEKVEALPEGSVVVSMLSDYTVLRGPSARMQVNNNMPGQ